MLSMIVTADKNWGISKEHKPLISIPDDIKFVRDTTYGKVVIMGRHTFESFFGGKPLPNRTTIIVARDTVYKAQGTIVAHSAEEAFEIANTYNCNIYVLGGKKLYAELMDKCDEIYVTAVDYVYSADAWFPNLDKKPEWIMVDVSEEQTHFDVSYYFKKYLRRKDYLPE